MTILVLNAGSSTLKYALFNSDASVELSRGVREGFADAHSALGVQNAVADVLSRETGSQPLTAIGHRVVHGGPALRAPTRITAAVLAQLRAMEHLAPLHNPACRAGIEQALARLPDVPQVAVFDTGFFADLPETAWRYALPIALADRLDIRRYGFHGISHQYVAGEAARLLQRAPQQLRLISLHLGNGASAAAIAGGRCIDVSMGMTPLEGLVMGTRAGDLDPGIAGVLHDAGFAAEDVTALFNRGAGLKGLCGTADMREIRPRAAAGDAAAALALAIFRRRIVKYVGAYYALLGGADALLFTGGIGENDSALRAELLGDLACFGLAVDAAANARHAAQIHADGSQLAAVVIPTREELAIARATANLLQEDH